MTTAWTAFHPEVLPFLPHCPEALATNAIRNAAIEFCEQTHWLIYESDPVTGVAGVATYTLGAPNDMTVLRIVDAWYDGYPLVGKSQEELRDMFPNDWRSQNGAPRYYTQIEACEIILVGTPQVTEAGALSAIVALQPTRTSLTTVDSLFNRWLETIAWGAKQRLYSTPGQPFTNNRAAGEAAGMFQRGVSRAKMERNRGLTRDSIKMRLPRPI